MGRSKKRRRQGGTGRARQQKGPPASGATGDAGGRRGATTRLVALAGVGLLVLLGVALAIWAPRWGSSIGGPYGDLLRREDHRRGDPVPAVERSPSASAAEVATAPGHTIPEVERPEAIDPLVAAAVRDRVAAVERSPQDAEAWGQLGRVYYAHRYVELARRCFETARRLAPESAAWSYYAGLLAADGGRSPEAIARFEETIRLRPDYLAAYERLGGVLLAAGRLPVAEQAYRELVARAPDAPWGYVGLGRAARRDGRLEEALAHLERARQLGPSHRQTAYLLAMTYRDLGRTERAGRLLDQLDSLAEIEIEDPLLLQVGELRTDLESRMELANRLLAAGQLERSASIYRQVLDVDPDHFDAHHNLGVLYGRTARYDRAEHHLEKAVVLRPTSAAAHFSLAMLHLSTDRPETAVAELERALELDPRHREARRYLERLRER